MTNCDQRAVAQVMADIGCTELQAIRHLRAREILQRADRRTGSRGRL